MFAILRPTAQSCIVRAFPGNGFVEKQRVHAKGWRATFLPAAYFSLLSAVNIGF
jgi:hypothetical protein